MKAISQKSRLYIVAVTLLLLLALTIGLSYVHLGPLSTAIALAIAVAKALLVLLYFMELRESPHLLWIMAGAGILWLLLLIGGSVADVLTRHAAVLPPG